MTIVSGFDVLIPIFSFLNIVLFDIKRLSYAVSFQNSAVGVSYGYWLDGSGFECRQGQDIFLSSKTPGSALGPTQPHIQCVPAFIPEDKSAGA